MILAHFTVRDNCLLALCSAHLYEICENCMNKSIRRYDSKDQLHDLRTLEHLLRRGNPLETISIVRVNSNEMNMPFAHQLTDMTMSFFKRSNCQALKSLTIRGCDFVTENGFRKIGEACNKLIIVSKLICFLNFY
jgi:hypothetical protein